MIERLAYHSVLRIAPRVSDIKTDVQTGSNEAGRLGKEGGELIACVDVIIIRSASECVYEYKRMNVSKTIDNDPPPGNVIQTLGSDLPFIVSRID